MKSCLANALFNPCTMVLSTTGWPGSGFLLRPLLFSASLLSLLLQPRSASFQSDQLLLLLPLTHSLTHFNPPNTTIHHLLKTSSLRFATLQRRHQHRQKISLPLSASSNYTLSFSVGPPDSPTTVQLYMDTGSDFVWFLCSPFKCILCESKETPSASPSPPPPPLASSHLIPCRVATCTTTHSNLASFDLCAISCCPLDAIETATSCASHSCPYFYYAYEDGSLISRLHCGPPLCQASPPPKFHLRLRPLHACRACRRHWLRPLRSPLPPLPARCLLSFSYRMLLLLPCLPLFPPRPPPLPEPPHIWPIPSNRRSNRTGLPIHLHPSPPQP